ncbi:MAG: PrsW family intramembrane metalloprotease [SAR324 cluster bacterium]|nr:PrsW family intramembrane metalloprotease [SAR324 cluster bacterium]
MIKVLVAAMITSGIWLLIIKLYEGKYSKPLSFMLWAGLMGGALSVEVASISSSILSDFCDSAPNQLGSERPVFSLLIAYYVGLSEEMWKFISAVLIIKWGRVEPKHPLDIMLLGITVSMGFELFENISYGQTYGWPLVFWRSLLPGHALYGAAWSFGLMEYFRQNQSTSGIQTLIGGWLLAAVLHATYDYFVFLDKLWTFSLAVVLTWGPIIILHFYLRRIQVLRPFRAKSNEAYLESNTSPAEIVKTPLRNNLFSESGKHPLVLAKAIYLPDDSANKLDFLRNTKKNQTGKMYNRNEYMQSLIKSIFDLMKSGKLSPDLCLTKKDSAKRSYCAINSSKAVMLSYSSLRMLDEIRQNIKNRSGQRYTRDQYLLGIINGLHYKDSQKKLIS